MNLCFILCSKSMPSMHQITSQQVNQKTTSFVTLRVTQLFQDTCVQPRKGKVSQLVPPLQIFIDTVLRKSQAKVLTILCALAFVKRLRLQFPIITQAYPCTLHRIFLACLILADKCVNDNCYTNYAWSRFSCTHWHHQVFSLTLEDIAVAERQLLDILKWKVSIVECEIQSELSCLLCYEAQC